MFARHVISKLAPDALRKLLKSFCEEDDTVKLQILNFAVKLFLSNPSQTSLMFKVKILLNPFFSHEYLVSDMGLIWQYVMDLCKYDMNYDVRDRARSTRCLPKN